MSYSWQTFLGVGLGGFFGAMLRFYVNMVVSKNFPHEIPFATLTVNIIGSFLIGSMIAIFLYFTPNDITRGFLITGFLGALTTYSTFAIESYFLLGTSFTYAILNITANLFGSILAAGAGYKILISLLK